MNREEISELLFSLLDSVIQAGIGCAPSLMNLWRILVGGNPSIAIFLILPF